MIGFFTLHALTWWGWGDEKLLVKGYEYLVGTEMCSPEFDGKILTEEYNDTTYTWVGKLFWMTSIGGVDTLSRMNVKGIERTIYSKKSKRWEGLLDEMYSSDIAFHVNRIDREYANPYYQNVYFSCWAYGSDWIEDHKPFLIWAFIGWIEVTDEETIANLINKYRD